VGHSVLLLLGPTLDSIQATGASAYLYDLSGNGAVTKWNIEFALCSPPLRKSVQIIGGL